MSKSDHRKDLYIYICPTVIIERIARRKDNCPGPYLEHLDVLRVFAKLCQGVRCSLSLVVHSRLQHRRQQGENTWNIHGPGVLSPCEA